MRPVRAAEAEAGAKVVDQVSFLLDGSQKSLIDGLLVCDTVLGGLLLLWRLLVSVFQYVIVCAYLGLLALLEECILTRLVGCLVLGEVTVLAGLLQNLLVNTLQVDRGGGSNDISCVDPSQGNTVDFERTSDEENTLGKVLEDDDALAAETTSEENDNGAGLEGLTGLRGAGSLACLKSELARSN